MIGAVDEAKKVINLQAFDNAHGLRDCDDGEFRKPFSIPFREGFRFKEAEIELSMLDSERLKKGELDEILVPVAKDFFHSLEKTIKKQHEEIDTEATILKELYVKCLKQTYDYLMSCLEKAFAAKKDLKIYLNCMIPLNDTKENILFFKARSVAGTDAVALFKGELFKKGWIANVKEECLNYNPHPYETSGCDIYVDIKYYA